MRTDSPVEPPTRTFMQPPMRTLMRCAAIGLTIVLAACGSDAATGTSTTAVPGAGDAVRGLPVFNGSCAAGLSDAELLAFLDLGRAAGDPLNTTGILMPRRGGNPALTDADLMDVIA